MKYTEAQINKLLRGVYDGVLDTQKLPENLYYAIAEHLEKGLCKGFGGTVAQFDAKPTLLINSMRENLYMFSGAKVYQQTSEMVAALQSLNRNLIKEDRLATFKEFKQDALQVYQKYNVNWLKTEYDTAIASGQMGERWAQIQEDSDILPYLTMSVVEDATTTEICRPLDKITLPINDVFWAKYYPPNHWNCRSTVLQTDDKTKLSSKKEIKHATDHAKKDVPEVFRMNVGKDGMVFSEKHPYFDVPKYDREFAANNFGLPFPKMPNAEALIDDVKEMMAAAKQAAPEINAIGNKYAKEFGGSVTPVNFKKYNSIKRKVKDDLGGDVKELKDPVRNTVVVDFSKLNNVVEALKKDSRFIRVKLQGGEGYYGYKGILANVKTENGLVAEMQVNSPGMIYAKSDKKDALNVMTKETYNEIARKTKLKGGLGHKYYEEIRVLKAKAVKGEATVAEMEQIEKLVKKSEDYYKNFYQF